MYVIPNLLIYPSLPLSFLANIQLFSVSVYLFMFYIKVYLYGLLKCQDSENITNTLDDFASELNMKAEDVKSIFYFWQEVWDIIVKQVKK